MPRYGTIDFDYAGRLANCRPDDDGPVFMVNYMKYRERAGYDDGSDQGRTGKEADDEYAPLEVLADIGAVVAFFGDVVDAHPGNASSGWDRIGIVMYPTRRSFIEMQSGRDFREKHTHKEAGMERTIVFAVPPSGIVVGAVPERSTYVVFDLVRHDAPTNHDSPTTGHSRHAVGPIEGVIVGDGRTFDELRITWTEVPVAATDQVHDRERVVVRAGIDRLGRLIAEQRDV